mmetsp:Transcript_10301/g.14555  ORF Transcript_10301/g.14555 Transcript_10301/m.14555 type:complete len:94 (+) Transcript_10301:258-539(+)
MSRVDGRKIVAVATTAVVAVVGFGTIYLPFMADRDKIRGLNEEDDMPKAAREEMERVRREQHEIGQMKETKIPQRSHPNSGSMWKNMGRGSGS